MSNLLKVDFVIFLFKNILKKIVINDRCVTVTHTWGRKMYQGVKTRVERKVDFVATGVRRCAAVIASRPDGAFWLRPLSIRSIVLRHPPRAFTVDLFTVIIYIISCMHLH